MTNLDQSQIEFCQSKAKNIRLLAPAGCGKTISLLYRCLELASQSQNSRFLIIAFTNSAVAELRHRLESEAELQPLLDRVNVSTLNAWGWRRIRNHRRNANLLDSRNDKYYAFRNQLRPVYSRNELIESVVNKPGSGVQMLMDVMDSMKMMGFDHTRDTNFELFSAHMDYLVDQDLEWKFQEQIDILAKLKIIGLPKHSKHDTPSPSRRSFYNRFFVFWREATERLLEEHTFTFTDQKYWPYLDLKIQGASTVGPQVHGAARYHHVMVDEFQDINPLDLSLIKLIAERNDASLTIVGDDDQAIFEWRGATPKFILSPSDYFGVGFTDHLLEVNYRSPRNIVDFSQRLIAHNEQRVAKPVVPVESSPNAIVELKQMDHIHEQLEFVLDLANRAAPLESVAVIGKFRRQLVPFQIYFSPDTLPFQTAVDLDVFNSKAFDDLVKVLVIWKKRFEPVRPREAVQKTLWLCGLIRRRPLGKADFQKLRKFLMGRKPTTIVESVSALKNYSGKKLSGKSHKKLYGIGFQYLACVSLPELLTVVGEQFDGLQFDSEKADEDVFFTGPPLLQLASIAQNGQLDVDDMIDRIEAAQELAQRRDEGSNDDSDAGAWVECPLHLMTAVRAKGKEFSTVVVLDVVDGVWPHKNALSDRQIEAERRLFYVAVTRAKERLVLVTSSGSPAVSPFVREFLGHCRG